MLGGVGMLAGSDACPALLEFMKDEGDDDMRQFATASFVEVINPESKKLVPLLLEMYKSKKKGFIRVCSG